MAKSFIDSHDRAIRTIATLLRDNGMEVVLLDYSSPEEIAEVAAQEDVDVIGVSFMSGGQVHVTTQLAASLEELGRSDIPVVVGGTIRPFDVESIQAVGVSAIFRGGEPLEAIATTFRQLAPAKGTAP